MQLELKPAIAYWIGGRRGDSAAHRSGPAAPAGRDWLAYGASLAKRLIGKKLFSPFRLMGTAFRTPLRFSYMSGHFESTLKARAVNRRGEPAPGYTFPADDFLEGKNFRTKRVLEFGAGQSTLCWTKRAASVVSFEGNRE